MEIVSFQCSAPGVKQDQRDSRFGFFDLPGSAVKVNYSPMTKRPTTTLGAVFLAAAVFVVQPTAQADTFGSGGNTFTLDFVTVGNTNNAADTTGYGSVTYNYRMGKYEVSQANIENAAASGLANVFAFAWTGNQPAAYITWYEAAAFVNWLNTSTGRQAAYNLTFSGSWSMSLWSSTNAWTLGGTNLYRHKDAYYFLPSENEWYKAAFYNPAGANYFDYATASDTAPTPVTGGTSANTAIFNNNNTPAAPAVVTNAGGLSPYGTMAQNGNVWDWIESAFDGTNDSATENRAVGGGNFAAIISQLNATNRQTANPISENTSFGFRVASVPEPSTYALLLMTGAGALYAWGRRRGSNRK